jgi:hypothetical protein
MMKMMLMTVMVVVVVVVVVVVPVDGVSWFRLQSHAATRTVGSPQDSLRCR